MIVIHCIFLFSIAVPYFLHAEEMASSVNIEPTLPTMEEEEGEREILIENQRSKTISDLSETLGRLLCEKTLPHEEHFDAKKIANNLRNQED
jgi:hypothetical protein